MKKKTIKKTIQAKVDGWLATIQDENVRQLAKDNTIVTGGCIASMLLREKVNDYDIYFRNRETAEAVARYYVERADFGRERMKVEASDDRVRIVTEAGHRGSTAVKITADQDEIEELQNAGKEAAEEREDQQHDPVFISTNAITLSGKIQIVLRFFGEPAQIHGNYDFVHCMNYWASWSGDLILRQDALEAILAKELIYVGSLYPVCSVFRMRKFIARNWTITAGQVLKMCMQISALDLTDPRVLEDQLTGVDVAYFCDLIARLKESDPEKVNVAYLIEIVNRMF